LVLKNIFSVSENCQFWALKTLILQTPARWLWIALKYRHDIRRVLGQFSSSTVQHQKLKKKARQDILFDLLGAAQQSGTLKNRPDTLRVCLVPAQTWKLAQHPCMVCLFIYLFILFFKKFNAKLLPE
jgi:hypothetical protein